MMELVRRIGADARARWQVAQRSAAVVWGCISLVFTSRAWPRTVREQIGKQILFTGYEALGLTSLIAVLAGVSVVAQAQLWLGRFGQSEMLGPLLITVIVREAGPLLVNFLVIARSGTAIVTELATMRVHGQVRVMDAQGLDPMIFLVMPRVVGMAVSILCLTIFFVVFSLAAGFIVGLFLDVGTHDPGLFIQSVLKPIRVTDIMNLIAKTLIPGVVTGVICCIEGLSITGSVTDVPQAATRAVVRSIAGLLIISAIISIMTYL
jgi:phospholipid/cholesterol/gamma-HCH transport system permease protein